MQKGMQDPLAEGSSQSYWTRGASVGTSNGLVAQLDSVSIEVSSALSADRRAMLRSIRPVHTT